MKSTESYDLSLVALVSNTAVHYRLDATFPLMPTYVFLYALR